MHSGPKRNLGPKIEFPWWRFLEATLRTWPQAVAETFESMVLACPVVGGCQVQCYRQCSHDPISPSPAPGVQCRPQKLVQAPSFAPTWWGHLQLLSALVREFFINTCIPSSPKPLKLSQGLSFAVLCIQLGTQWILSKEKFCVSAILSGDQTRLFLKPNGI